jgi:uncharacterized membrane protein YdjX (TVP38/TMEM64 family)
MRSRHVFRRLGQLGPLAAAAAFLPPLGTLVLLGTIEQSSGWLRSHGVAGVLVFVVGFALCGGFALLPTYTPAVVGGWAFGPVVGLSATLVGFVLAATIGFSVARRLSGDRLLQVLRDHPRGLAIHDAFVRSGFWKALVVVALLRLPPNSPFAMGNVLMAASRVAYAPFLLGTIIGLSPRAAAGVLVGAGLAQIDFANPERSGMVVLGVAVTIGVVVTLGWMANRALARIETYTS